MKLGELGRVYKDGEIIVRQGEVGEQMYVIQHGQAQVFQETHGEEVPLRLMDKGEFIGEMAIFERQVHSATVRAVGEVRVLTVDKESFLQRVHEDPSLAFRMVQVMSRRIRELSAEVARLKGGGEA